MYLCLCKGLTESDVRRACDGCPGAEALAERLGLTDRNCCGRCIKNMDRILTIAASVPACESAAVHPHSV